MIQLLFKYKYGQFNATFLLDLLRQERDAEHGKIVIADSEAMVHREVEPLTYIEDGGPSFSLFDRKTATIMPSISKEHQHNIRSYSNISVRHLLTPRDKN